MVSTLQNKWLPMRRMLCAVLSLALLLTLISLPAVSYAKGTGTTNAQVVLRKTANTKSQALQTLGKGTKVTILSTGDSWYRVRYGQYTGYIMRKYIVKDSASASVTDQIEDLGTPPGIMRVGDANSDVTKLQSALKILGYYHGAVDGKYGDKTKQAVKEYQRDEGLEADGYAGELTVKHIFGSCNPKSKTTQPTPGKKTVTATAKPAATPAPKVYKTEVLDWFRDYVSRVIPKNATFTIKDVQTSKTFKAIRWSGGNHMDAEPLTASDTAIMKGIYGGSWSWRRRPILILYNDHVYAASMNGMPHGSDDIVSGNNFDGMFCIHFRNSKTHGTDKVDPDHQNAVTKAGKATW